MVWLGWCGIRMQAEALVFQPAQHVSDVNTSILRSLQLIYFMDCIALVRCVLVLRCGLAGVVWYPDAVLQPAAEPQPNTNTHLTRAIQPMK